MKQNIYIHTRMQIYIYAYIYARNQDDNPSGQRLGRSDTVNGTSVNANEIHSGQRSQTRVQVTSKVK